MAERVRRARDAADPSVAEAFGGLVAAVEAPDPPAAWDALQRLGESDPVGPGASEAAAAFFWMWWSQLRGDVELRMSMAGYDGVDPVHHYSEARRLAELAGSQDGYALASDWLSAALSLQGHADAAWAVLTEAVGRVPSDAGLRVARAKLGVMAQQQDLASGDAYVALELDPYHSEAAQLVCEYASFSGRHDEALAALDRALALRPDAVPVAEAKARLLLSRQRPADALATLNELVAARPTDPGPVLLLGQSLIDMGRPLDAAPLADRAMVLTGGLPDAWDLKARSLIALGRVDEGLAFLDHGLLKYPKDAQLWETKGVTLTQVGRPTEAIECFRSAVNIRPKDVQLLSNFAALLSGAKRHLDAYQMYERILAIEPGHGEAWLQMGICLAKLDRHEEAADCYRKATDSQPQNVDAWRLMAASLEILRRHHLAIAALERAVSLNAFDAKTRELLGQILWQVGRRDDAIQQMRAAVNHQGGRRAASALAKMLEETGRAKEARAVRKEAGLK
jgi:tetratricopeptide (TPR) repeat protein